MDDGRRRRPEGARWLPAVAGALCLAVALPHAAHAVKKRAYVQKRFLQVLSGSTVSVAFRRPNTAGNLIVAYVVWDGGGAATVTDSAGNAYQTAIGPTQLPGDPTSAQVFYAANVAGGINALTATFASPVTTHGVLYNAAPFGRRRSRAAEPPGQGSGALHAARRSHAAGAPVRPAAPRAALGA